MEFLEEDERAKIQNEYEQIFGIDCQVFRNENIEEKASAINNQTNNEAILNNYSQSNIYESSYVQAKNEEDEKNAEESAKLFIERIEQVFEEKKKKIIPGIDRFEGDIANCENRETEEMININKSELPEGISEGDVLTFDGEEYEIDEEKKKEIEERIKSKIRNIFEEN